MVEKKVKIHDPNGLHARPAKRLVELAKGFACDTVRVNGAKEGMAKNLIKLMKLGITCGTEVTVRCTGSDEGAACTAITKMLAEMTD